MSDLVEQYKKEGFAVVDNALDPQKLELFKESYLKLVLKLATKFGIDQGDLSEDYLINRVVPEIYANNADAGGFLYDVVNRHFRFLDLFHSEVIINSVSSFLDCKKAGEDIAITNQQYFIHLPNVQREMLGWHQDSGYYREYSSENETCVAWFCMDDCMKNDGALWAIPGSHLDGPLPHIVNEFGKHKDMELSKRGRIYIEDQYFDESKAVQIELKKGQVLLININLIHKSGNNVGNKVRNSALCRYSNIYSKGYIPKYNIW